MNAEHTAGKFYNPLHHVYAMVLLLNPGMEKTLQSRAFSRLYATTNASANA